MEEISIFEKFVLGQEEVEKLYEDDYVIAINDINPLADIHVLVISKKKFVSLIDAENISTEFLGNFLKSISKVAKFLNIKSYNVIFNNGKDAGQTVFYCHAHILSKINKK